MEPLTPKQNLEPGVFSGGPNSTPEKSEQTPKRQISTMKLDAMEAIKKQDETVVSIAIAEQKKATRLREEASLSAKALLEKNPPQKRRGRFVVIVILLFIISLLGLLYYLLPKFNLPGLPNINISIPSFERSVDTTSKPDVAVNIPLAPSIIKAQSEKRFNISKESTASVIEAIVEEKKQDIPVGNIKNLYFTESSKEGALEISANRLFIFLGKRAPETLSSVLEKPFMAGFLSESNNTNTPFLVLKVSDLNTGIAGMLEWETGLPRFFDSLFGTNIENGGALGFKDMVVLGKDTRSIDTSGAGSITYTFVNNETILIAGSRSALEAILPLLAVKK